MNLNTKCLYLCVIGKLIDYDERNGKRYEKRVN